MRVGGSVTWYELMIHNAVHWMDQSSTITVKPVCNDHLYNKIYYLWFIQ